MTVTIPMEQLVPGGIRPGDHLHVETNDNTCSRCRAEIGNGEVPLMLFVHGGADLYIYCGACTDPEGRFS